MIPRGSVLRAFGVGALAAATLLAFSALPASGKATTSVADTLTLSLPGPLNGCSVLDPAATPTTGAVLDLLKPSAFLTSQGGSLVGAGGAIVSAELVSLKPETVVYTLAPKQHWSNGDSFDGVDLVAWWLKAKALASVQSDGYRDIKSLSESNNGLSVTATFSSDYAEWNLLFRDIEDVGAPGGCSWASYLARPTLGPYKLAAASAHQIVLVANKRWTANPNRFKRIVVTDSPTIPANPSSYFVSYSLTVTRANVQALSLHPSIVSHIGTYSDIAEVTFAPGRPVTRSLLVREGLSWSIDRQALINRLFGTVTFSPSVASSVLYSQGQGAYPGGGGNGPSAQSTTTTISSKAPNVALADCATCAVAAFRKAGYVRSARGWLNAAGGALTVRVAVGPSALDRATAASVEAQWRTRGITVQSFFAGSDESAASAAATNGVDVAIFMRPTTTTASYTARSWSGPQYPDTYPSGVRSSAITKLFNTAVQNFNPVSASGTWLQLDQLIMTNFLARPLYTAPSLVEASNLISTVYSTISVPGLVDQALVWSPTLPSQQGS